MTSKKSLAATVPPLLLVGILAAPLAEAARRTRLDAETIKAGLRTTRVEEQGFVDVVIQLVNEGRLSRSLVESSFQWARKKVRHRFQYFRASLVSRMSPGDRQLLAARLESPQQAPKAADTSGAARLFRIVMFSLLRVLSQQK